MLFPVNYAKNIADQIIDGKTPVHPYMGATLSSVNALNARTNKLSTDSGVCGERRRRTVLLPGRHSRRATSSPSWATTEITSADGLIIALRSSRGGREGRDLAYARQGKRKKVTVELGSDEELQNQQQDDSSTDTGNGGITDEQLRQYLEGAVGPAGRGWSKLRRGLLASRFAYAEARGAVR